MTPSSEPRNPVDRIAEEFIGRYRRGERPSITEFALRHPASAEEIRRLFPVLALVEQAAEPAGSHVLPPPPQQLGEYRLLREIGRGGMGVVYEAEQSALGRHVALKVLPAEGGDLNRVERFLREARAAARLHHPHIVPVFDVGEHAGLRYYAMQYIEGESLDALVRMMREARFEASEDPCWMNALGADSRREYFRRVAEIGRQIADALEFAHQRDIVHRDVKPSNVLLDRSGRAWIADFGLAKESQQELTTPGEVVGTLRYMAPERLNGRADRRSDIYSLGLTLYELLSLQPAFDESDRLLLIHRICHAEPVTPSHFDPAVPRDLETIVLRAIAKEPEARYASGFELAGDLERFLADEPIAARRTSGAERAWRWCRRNPIVAGLLVAVLFLGSTLSAAGVVLRILREDRDRAVTAEAIAQEARTRAQAAERETKVRAHLFRASAWRHSGQSDRKARALDEIRSALLLKPSAELEAELEREAVAAFALTGTESLKICSGCPPGTAIETFDPDYTFCARCDSTGKIHVASIPEETQVASFYTPDGAAPLRLALGSGGRFLASLARPGRELYLWDLRSGRPDAPARLGACREFRFSADGARLAVCRTENSVDLVDCADPGQAERITTLAIPYAAAFSSDGGRLAVCCGAASELIELWSTRAPRRTGLLRVGPGVEDVAWHPDGNRLALALAREARAEIWNVADRERTARMEGHRGNVVRVEFDSTGRLLGTGSWDATCRVWETDTGRELLVLPACNLGWSATGDIIGIASTPESTQAVSVDRSDIVRTLTGGPRTVEGKFYTCEFSPDGMLLVAGMEDGIRVWDVASGRLAASLALESATLAAFIDQGRSLLTCGALGIFVWPMDGGTEGVKLGPPRKIIPQMQGGPDYPSTNGELAAVCERGRLLVGDLASGAVQEFRTDPAHNFAILSSDGSRVTTYGWHSSEVLVWNLHGRELEKTLSLGAQTFAFFSPDSRELVTCRAGEYAFWGLADWSVARRLARQGCPFPGVAAGSPDGTVLAVELSPAEVHLVDAATHRTLARLEGLLPARPTWMVFSPDGSQLACICDEVRSMHVLHLGRIGARLGALGFRWGLPDTGTAEGWGPPAAARIVQFEAASIVDPTVARRRQVLAERAVRLAFDLPRQGNWGAAVAELERALSLAPGQHSTMNHLAWLLATCPNPALHDPAAAIELAELALDSQPESSIYWNTLGVACFRAGRWEQAVAALSRSEELGSGEAFAHNALFLAMVRWQLQDREGARHWLRDATEWIARTRLDEVAAEEIGRFRSEAEALIGPAER